MKLPIKQQFLDEIKLGKKLFEYRDAHLTLISEETGEELKVNVLWCKTMPKRTIPQDIKYLFEDNKVIAFRIEVVKKNERA